MIQRRRGKLRDMPEEVRRRPRRAQQDAHSGCPGQRPENATKPWRGV